MEDARLMEGARPGAPRPRTCPASSRASSITSACCGGINIETQSAPSNKRVLVTRYSQNPQNALQSGSRVVTPVCTRAGPSRATAADAAGQAVGPAHFGRFCAKVTVYWEGGRTHRLLSRPLGPARPRIGAEPERRAEPERCAAPQLNCGQDQKVLWPRRSCGPR